MRARDPRVTAGASAVAAWLLPAVATACPVCVDPRGQDQSVFLSMTIFMSLLPLGLIGGAVTWVVRSAQRNRE